MVCWCYSTVCMYTSFKYCYTALHTCTCVSGATMMCGSFFLMYVCMYVYTCYVLISPPMPIHYVLADVFASCFYVLIYLLQEWWHIFYYVLAAVFASCFYVLFKIRFVSKATQGGPSPSAHPSAHTFALLPWCQDFKAFFSIINIYR